MKSHIVTLTLATKNKKAECGNCDFKESGGQEAQITHVVCSKNEQRQSCAKEWMNSQNQKASARGNTTCLCASFKFLDLS